MVVSCPPRGFPNSRIRLHRSETTNINASIVDLRVTGIVEAHPEWFPWPDENRRKSAAFVILCMSTALELPLAHRQRSTFHPGIDSFSFPLRRAIATCQTMLSLSE